MWHIVKKGNKYLNGHSYATGLGYRFTWSAFLKDAIRFRPKSSAEGFANLTKGKCLPSIDRR